MLTDRRLRAADDEELHDLAGRVQKELERRRYGEDARDGDEAPKPQTVEERPYEDGRLQLEVRFYRTNKGEYRERGPYWYFHHHENGRQRKRYIGTEKKIKDPEVALVEKRAREGW